VWFTITAHLELNHSTILLKFRQNIFIKFPEIQIPALETMALHTKNKYAIVSAKFMFTLR
jgi:hypothetical protein